MRKVDLKDIAEYVGVSTALVSYVLNGNAEKKRVNTKTAERIMEAAKKLNYRPNFVAKSLKMNKTHTIGLVVADVKYRFTTGVMRSIESEAKKSNYIVIYGSSNENMNSFNELINVFIGRQVDGLILISVSNSEERIKFLQNADVPFVLLDRYFPDIKANHIALDNYTAAYKATQYLVMRGCKRISIINLKSSLFHLHERNRGYLDSLKANKIVFETHWLQEVKSSDLSKGVALAIDKILAKPSPCDAVFFATDTIAIQGLMYLNKIKVKIPDKLSVLSFDESEVFDLFYCPITHFKQPLKKMGELAVNTLIQLINHNKINVQISLEGDLVVGKSCGEP